MYLFPLADLSAVRRLMSSGGAKSSPAVSSAGSADVCPSCRLPFDKGKKRRLVDTGCGHQRCYQCMFRKQECPLCPDRAGGRGGGSGVRSMQSGGKSPILNLVSSEPLPPHARLKSSHSTDLPHK